MTTTPDATLYPPRWQPALLRWHRTRVSWWQSWKLAAQAMRLLSDHSPANAYGARLPGQDDVMVARIPLQRYVVIRSPELARHVLVTNQDNYPKSADYDMLAVAFGRGLGTERNEDRWQRNRRLVQPVFGKRNIATLAGPVTEAAHDCAARVRRLGANAAPVDMNAEMSRLTVDIVARTMFGLDLTGPMSKIRLSRMLGMFGFGFLTGVTHRLHALAELTHRHNLPMRVMRCASWVLAPRMMADLRHLERVIDQLIADHRSGAITRRGNLLALLMDAHDPETGHRYTDAEIHDELMTFLGAGTETTATALAWTWKLLAENPDARSRLHAELDDVLAGRTPTAADVDLLPWTKAVLAETMRLYPPVVALARVAKNDDLLGDFPIRAGTTIMINLHAMHQHGGVWPDPDTFDPTRYLTENLTTAQRHAALPFGAGKRMCVANVFASTEAVLALATIAQRIEMDLATTEPIRPQFSFTGGPDGPLPMFVRDRPARAELVN